MNLKVLGPSKVILQAEVTRVIARGSEGYFCLLPRHVDYVTYLSGGPLAYDDSEGHGGKLDIGEGILVKCGDDILVSLASGPKTIAGESGACEAIASLKDEFTGQYLKAEKGD